MYDNLPYFDIDFSRDDRIVIKKGDRE